MFDHYGTPTFQPVPLDRFGLRKKWRKLDTLQAEALDLLERHAEAAATVAELEAGRDAAFEADLEAHSRAIRAGEASPEPQHAPSLDREIQDANRTVAALHRAAEDVGRDIAAYRAKHGAKLYADVLAANQGQAEELAGHAREAADLYIEVMAGRDLAAQLAPPPAPEPEPSQATGPQRLTVLYAMPQTRATFGGGPQPGEVTAVLGHLQSLAGEATVEPVEDVADSVARATPVEGEKPAAETIVGAVPDEGE